MRVFFTLKKKINELVIALGISSLFDQPIRTTWSKPQDLGEGNFEAVFKSDSLILADGQYKMVIGISSQKRTLFYKENTGILIISDVSSLSADSQIINTKSGLIINQMEVTIIAK